MKKERMKVYWRKNIQYVLILLSIWFISSYGFGILLADELNQIRMGGFKLDFWFAQQGSIYIFVLIIFIYVYLMNKLDKEFDPLLSIKPLKATGRASPLLSGLAPSYAKNKSYMKEFWSLSWMENYQLFV